MEDIFSPSFQQPKYRPLGTPGYQHRTSSRRHCDVRSDRFAGAILLAEMLGWYDKEVRTLSYGESYFEPAELQSNGCHRFEVLANAIARYDNSLAGLLGSAWKAITLDDCPPLYEWNRALKRVTSESTARYHQASWSLRATEIH